MFGLLSAGVALAAGFIRYYWLARRKRDTQEPHPTQAATEPTMSQITSQDIVHSDTDFLVRDQDGNALICTRELYRLPTQATILTGKDQVAVNRARQLVGDLFKGSVSLPGKTVELVFDSKVQQGLREGTLEVVPAAGGGARLMARDVESKAFSGHGRILDGGCARQMAAGAFHILSIAVAQSHLDDINRGLTEIKIALEDVKRYFGDKDKAKLRGTLVYLEYLVSMMNDLGSPEKVPSEKRNQLEAIRRETMEWVEQLRYEAVALQEQIDAQQDVDSWGGTENTFNALKSLAGKMTDLIEKRNTLLRIMALLEVGSVYLDPLGNDKTSSPFISDSTQDMKTIEMMLGTIRDRSNQLLSKSLWNKETTLNERRTSIMKMQEELLALAVENQSQYAETMNSLRQHLQRIRKSDKEIHMALTFDQEGVVKQVALL